jgi:UDP-N-acetylmuramoylalanine--D-glutamate ligase
MKRGLGYAELARAAHERVRLAVLFGESGEELASCFRGAGIAVVHEKGLEDAVRTALARTPPGEALLFSPACASFDGSLNWLARARAFRSALPARG